MNYPKILNIEVDGKLVVDTVPDEIALGIMTKKGWLLLTGCAHAGIINSSEKLKSISNQPIYMVAGGFHLIKATEKRINWTAKQLKKMRVKRLLGAHCTGTYALSKIANKLNLSKEYYSNGSIGTIINKYIDIIRPKPFSIE